MAKPLLPTILRRPRVLMGSQRLFKVERTIAARKSTPSMLLDCFRHELPTALGNSDKVANAFLHSTASAPRTATSSTADRLAKPVVTTRSKVDYPLAIPASFRSVAYPPADRECGPVWLGKVTNRPFTTGTSPAVFRAAGVDRKVAMRPTVVKQIYRCLRNIQQHRPQCVTFFNFRWSQLAAISNA
jgi:hypothetical protein